MDDVVVVLAPLVGLLGLALAACGWMTVGTARRRAPGAEARAVPRRGRGMGPRPHGVDAPRRPSFPESVTDRQIPSERSSP